MNDEIMVTFLVITSYFILFPLFVFQLHQLLVKWQLNKEALWNGFKTIFSG